MTINDFGTHQLILACQFFLLGSVVTCELLSRRKNFFALIVALAILLLIHGQAAWIFAKFYEEGQFELVIGYHALTWASIKQANIIYLWTVCAFVFGWAIFRLLKRSYKVSETSQRKFRFGWLGHTLVSIWLIIMAIALIKNAGGLEVAVTQPGQLIGGQTVLLLAVSIAKWPLLCRVIFFQKLRLMDVLLFLGALLMLLLNSRFLTCFAVLQVLLAIHYCRTELKIRWLAIMAVPAFLILIVFGVYREFGHRKAMEADNFVAFKDTNFDTLDWFYNNNVEGFAGVSGIIERELSSGLSHDYGLSQAAILLRYIPNSIRNDPNLPFLKWEETLKGVFPYDRSVVPSGFELSYGHFGPSGMVSYGLCLGILCGLFHSQARLRTFSGIFCLIIGIQLLNGVRGSLMGAIMFFGLADLLAFAVIYCLGKWLPHRVSRSAPALSCPLTL